MKRLIAIILALMSCFVFILPAGAEFTQTAQRTELFTSYAGYTFNVDDYYNYMRRYAGKEYTKYWHSSWASCSTTAKCYYDSSDTLHVSLFIKYPDGETDWHGISVTKTGHVNVTTALNSFNPEYNRSSIYEGNITWNAYTGSGIYEYTCSDDSSDNTSYNFNDLSDYLAVFGDKNWIAETIRECYWYETYYNATNSVF